MKLLRVAVGLSQVALARRVGRDQSLLSRIECGLQAPTPDLAGRIAEILNSTPAELFGDVAAARTKKGAGDEARRD